MMPSLGYMGWAQAVQSHRFGSSAKRVDLQSSALTCTAQRAQCAPAAGMKQVATTARLAALRCSARELHPTAALPPPACVDGTGKMHCMDDCRFYCQ